MKRNIEKIVLSNTRRWQRWFDVKHSLLRSLRIGGTLTFVEGPIFSDTDELISPSELPKGVCILYVLPILPRALDRTQRMSLHAETLHSFIPRAADVEVPSSAPV